jgi:Ca-activated chloride channel homolog
VWMFSAPGFLLLLPAVPVGIYFRHIWNGRGGVIRFPYSLWGGRGFAAPVGLRVMLYAVATVGFWAGVVLLIIALAGPERAQRERLFLSRGVDIVVVVDQSPTMAARDFQPDNRFETAKAVIRGFVDGRENDPIGVVGFGAEAALWVPPTLDYGQVVAALDRMRVMDLGDGTAIGMGIAVAALHLSHSSADDRVIVLLTDGINNAGEIQPETAARAASELGIRIYAVGIGSRSEVEISFEDPRDGRVYRGTVSDSFDEELLRRLAALTDGAYFYAGSAGTLRDVFASIDSIERTEKRVLVRIRREPAHLALLLVGICLIVLDFVTRKFLIREVL